MTPAEALADHRSFINDLGETIYIKRTGVSPDTATKARVMSYEPSQLIGPIVQGDRRIIALVDDLGAILPLTTNDELIVRGKTLAIKAIDDNTRRVAGTLIALEIQASG